MVRVAGYRYRGPGFDSKNILPGDVLRVGPTGGEQRKGFYLH